MNFHLTEVSTNVKTGPIPVVTATRQTCPTSCPLLGDGGCYAEGGPLRIHWNAVTNGTKGVSLDELCKRIARLPSGQIWRYGQAGDLPGEGDDIDGEQLMQLAKANRGRPVIAFTHKPPTSANLQALADAKAAGFHVNLSADTLAEADELAETGNNVVVVLHEDYGRKTKKGEWAETLTEYRDRISSLPRYTPGGKKIAICPATYTETRCIDCRACATTSRRDPVIGFPAHGNRRRKILTG